MTTDEHHTEPVKSTQGERLNFIIAVCAILISAASFYATYLQADAANKQVKAMTMPMIQYGHGNLLGEDERVVNFSLRNAGVGPALIKQVRFHYQNQAYNNMFEVLNVCCEAEVKGFLEVSQQPGSEVPEFVTTPVVNTIIPGQDKQMFLRLRWHEDNQALWERLNELRFDVGFTTCYCSLLDECYESNERAEIKPVAQCSVKK